MKTVTTSKYIFEPLDGNNCRLMGLTESFLRGRPITWFTIPSEIEDAGKTFVVTQVDPKLVEDNPKAKAKWYFKAKKAGHPYADVWLKELYPEIMHQNMEEAFEIIYYMAMREEDHANFWMAVACTQLEEIGKVPSSGQGIKIIRELAEKGISEAREYLENLESEEG